MPAIASAPAPERKPPAVELKTPEQERRERMERFFAALSDSERLRWVKLIEMQVATRKEGHGIER